MKDLIPAFQQAVLSWYNQNGRQLPWRQTTDPYAILVSEIMLQQTQAPRVIPKYEAWLRQFPTVHDLAAASPAAVIQAWAGLGYNRRALYLQRTAQAISQLNGFPTTYEELIKLPGIGPYTAAAVLAFAYNTDIALADTNIKRIYQLIVFGDEADPTDKQVRAVATDFLPTGQSRLWHNALMDIGTILSSCRGAKAQQDKLIELFPILKQFPLPAVSEAPLKRPKQSNFKTSRRYWRGQIITLLRLHQNLSMTELEQLLPDSPYPLTELVDALASEGLLTKQDQTLTLPQ